MKATTNFAEAMKPEIEKALKVLKEGGLILYPTDTIWGIGCDATNEAAVEKIYKIKQRSDSKSLIILAANPDMVCKYVEEVPDMALELMEVNDKPMTIIYPKGVQLAKNVLAADGSVGIRVPMNDFCVKLITRFHKPIVSTSANISGTKAPKSYEDIAPEILQAVDCIIDPSIDEGSTHQASQIIKVGIHNEIEIIRQ